MANMTQNQNNVPMGQGNKKLDSNNLKVLEDQLTQESLLTKKFSNYANSCTDTELKSLCEQASQTHKQHYSELLNYLNSHQ